MGLETKTFSIQGPILFQNKVFKDSRGFFCERFKLSDFEILDRPFVQENFSRSAPRVLRGLHYQFAPAQGKLVTCMKGKIFDVAVDIRRDSKTFGRHVSVVLDGDSPSWFWVPAGFAHGFLNISDSDADVIYKVDQPYGPTGEGAIIWNDSDLAIDWPIKNPLLSDKDLAAFSFKNYSLNSRF
jgi:dTDP-4-dehydrorhamnose 3,5-epimerase